MGEQSKIEWTDHTFNPWRGCARVSPGCEHCYAEAFAKRVGFTGKERPSGKPTLPLLWGVKAERQVASEAMWREPVKWNRAAEKAGKRAKVFCASMADVFEDRPNPKPGFHYVDVLREARARLWKLIHETPHLDWLLLTKRPENAERLALQAWSDAFALSTTGGEPDAWWLQNIWLGTTCEDQQRANERLPHLLAIPAAVRFVSYEPALGPIDFTRIVYWERPGPPFPIGGEFDALRGFCGSTPAEDTPAVRGLQWVIVGGESGSGARPFDLAWMRSTIEQCRAAGVAVFAKQLGARPLVDGRGPESVEGLEGRWLRDGDALWTFDDPKGGDWSRWPHDLRVREWPR